MRKSEAIGEILEVLNKTFPLEDEDGELQEGIPEHAAVTAFALVFEWDDGTNRGLTKLGAFANGRVLPRWQENMLFHEGINWDDFDGDGNGDSDSGD